MSTPFQCDDKDTLIAFVYGEVDDEMRRQVKAHLRACASCADEVDGLQAVRRDLLEWQPPEIGLNFAVVQKPATVLRPARWSAPLPAWAQVAAAVLLFATGVAISNVRVHYGGDGLTVTTGWMSPAAATGANQAALKPGAPAGTDSSAPTEDWRPALIALEQNLRAEMQAMRRTQPDVRDVSTPAVDTNALMRRVDARINETEQRHREELATRMTQFARDMQTDLFRLNQGFRQLQGETGLIKGNQRQMADLMRRVSTQQIP
jgi:hypothetical protein